MDLVFEIGCEELPAGSLQPAVESLSAQLSAGLNEARLAAESIQRFATPRRLTLIATGLPARAPDMKKTVQGPPAKTAFGPDGKPTRAGEGFARKLGVPASALRLDGDRVVVDQELKGSTAQEALPAILEKLIQSIPFRKVMRWGDGTAVFARPVHWIAAALDGELLPVRFGEVTSSLVTRGHRFHAPAELALPAAADYLNALRERHVLADWDERRRRVWEEVCGAAKQAGGEPLPDEELLETVTGLCEEPSGVLGRFEPSFLELPPEVLVSEMRGHQKYFAVRDPGSKALLPAFVAISNTKVIDAQISRRGYERVLRARLSDGRFFFDEDRKTPLTARLERLSRITFFQGMGTQAERVARLGKLAAWLQAKTRRGEAAALARAALLCKADLTCGMVSEFPDLQGAMGRVYAKGQGEPAAVAEAIFEHYLPRGAEDGLPAGDDGALLGIADRLDQLTGFFGLGKEPSGTADPYGLRRAAIGLLRLVLAKRFRFDLAEALAQAQALHNAQGDRVSASPSLASTIWAFLAGRCEVLWRERGAPDTVQAVLGTGSRDLVSLQLRLDALTAERGSGASGQGRSANFEATCAAFKRIANINAQALEKKLPPTALNPALLAEGSDAERGLGQALAGARERMQRALGGAGPAGDGQAKEPPSREAGEDYPAAWAVLAELRPSVDRFFDEVMVMDPDTRKRDNRLALLRGLQEIFAPLADFSRLQAG